jgi:hypothetical protein
MSLVLITTMDEYDSHLRDVAGNNPVDFDKCPHPEYLPCLAAVAYLPESGRIVVCFVYVDAALRLIKAGEQLAEARAAGDVEEPDSQLPVGHSGIDFGEGESFAAEYRPTPSPNEWRMQIMAILAAMIEECASIGVIRLEQMPLLVAAKLARIDQDNRQRDDDLARGVLSVVEQKKR